MMAETDMTETTGSGLTTGCDNYSGFTSRPQTKTRIQQVFQINVHSTAQVQRAQGSKMNLFAGNG